MTIPSLNELKICVKGAGEMASGVACRLFRGNLKRIVMLEADAPLAVRRRVSFSEAVYQKSQLVEDIPGVLTESEKEIQKAWSGGKIAIQVDPQWHLLNEIGFDVVIDAILAKHNLGTQKSDGKLVIGLGPGFTASEDVHLVIETQRGHNLGRVIKKGSAIENTGIPGNIGGYTIERVLRAPTEGVLKNCVEIGEQVGPGDLIATVFDQPINTQIKGIVRGLIRNETTVQKGFKVGDIDPREDIEICNSISEKASAIGGAVLEAILMEFNR